MTTLLATLACLGTLLAAGALTQEADPGSDTTSVVARRYVQLQFQERDPACFDLLAEDVHFIDPTAAFFGDGPTVRGVTSKAEFRELHDSWSIEASRLDVRHFLTMGDFAIAAGAISWKNKGRSWVEEVPFATILEVRDGVVASRRDYGEYDRLGPQPVPGKQDLVLAADAYIEAYAALDVDAVAEMLAPEAVLVDPTTNEAERRSLSRDALLASLEEARSKGTSLRLDTTYRLACGQQALFLGEGHLSYRATPEAEPVEVSYPYLVVLTFEGGAVVEHRRYLDHVGLWKRLRGQDA